jgi:hypothetical protein
MWTFTEWFTQNPEMFPEGTTYEESQEIRAAWMAAGQGNPDQVMDEYTFKTRLEATTKYMEEGEVGEGGEPLDETTAEGMSRRERRLRKRMVAQAVLQTQEQRAIDEAVQKVRREEQEKQEEHRKKLEEEDKKQEEEVRKAAEEDEKAHPDETAAQRDARRNREAAKRRKEQQAKGQNVQPGDTQRSTVGVSQDQQERQRQEAAGIRGQADISKPGAPTAHPASNPDAQPQRAPGQAGPAQGTPQPGSGA